MFLFDAAFGRRKSATRPLNLVLLAFCSILFGMLTEFGWRGVFHDGIAGIFSVVVLGILTVGLAERRARKRAERPQVQPSNFDR